jgi:hypothetical protein
MNMAKIIETKKIAKRHIRARLPLLLFTGAALAASSISCGGPFVANQSPLHDSAYSWTEPVPQKAAKAKPKGAKRIRASKIIKCAATKAPAMAIAQPDALSVSSHGKENRRAPFWASVLAGIGLFALIYGIRSLRAKRRKKGRHKAVSKGIPTRFERENLALRLARRVVMAQALCYSPKPMKKPALTVDAITKQALALAKKMPKKTAAKKFLLAVDAELTAEFDAYDVRLRPFYRGIKSV